MTPGSIYWLSLIAIIAGCLIFGFGIGARTGYDRGYKAAEDEWFDDDDDDQILDDAILEDIYAD